MHLTKVVAIFAMLVLLAAPAFAELTDFESGAPAQSSNMTLGLGVATVPDYEGSDDYTTAPLVLFHYGFASGRYIDVLGNRAKVNLLTGKQFQLGPVLQYRAKRDNNVDDSQVKLMNEINTALETGLFAGIDINNWLASLQVTKDVNAAHSGTLVTVNGSYRYNMSKTLTLVPGISATWASDKYMETYFSVNGANRGSSTLPNFDADGGFKDVTMAMLADYHPWQNWKIVGGIGYKSLLNDAKDSPVVDDRGDNGQAFAGVALAYQWR
jgi:outer membrane protein